MKEICVEDYLKGYLIFGPTGRLVDIETGEIYSDVVDMPQEDLKRIRNKVNWQASLDHDSKNYGKGVALSNLLYIYHLCYWEYPDFTPGFAIRRFSKDDRGGDDADVSDRGLSNTNKVHAVVIKKIDSGEYITIDKKKSRISRMRRRIFSWADTLKDYLDETQKYRKVMITLTYSGVDDWKPNHIRDYMKALKRKLGENLIASAWISELQMRGAVHYHVILVCKKGTRVPIPDKSGMWKYGMSKIETAKTVYYLCSYLKKSYQKEGEFPKGMRMYSVWISKGAVATIAHWMMRLSSLPKWFAEKVLEFEDHKGDKWERQEGGGWLFAGKTFRSPYYFMGIMRG
jgi:hypothetical protein